MTGETLGLRRPVDGGRSVDAAAETWFLVRGDGVILDCEPGWANELGLTLRPAGIVGRRVGELLDAEAAAWAVDRVRAALESGEVRSCVLPFSPGGRRVSSYWRAWFRRVDTDEVAVVVGDCTAEVCRRAADEHLHDVTRSVVGARGAAVDLVVRDVLRRTAEFVGGRGALVVVPDEEDPLGFRPVHMWTPGGVAQGGPERPPGHGSWFAAFLRVLERPVILETDGLPTEAVGLRWFADRQGLEGIGVVPLALDPDRTGAIAVGFPTAPNQVERLRFESLGLLAPLLLGAMERQRIETEESIQQAQERFRSIMHRSPDIVLGLDEEAHLVFVSPSVREVLGYEPAELHGENVLTFLHPDDRSEAFARFESLPRGGSTRSSRVLRIRHRDGSSRRVECVLTDFRDDPVIGSFVAVARDVTEQVEAYEALERDEAHVTELLRRSTDLFAVIGADGTLLRPTPNSVLGYATGSVVGRNPFDLVHPDERDDAERALRRAVRQSEDVICVQLRLKHSDGSWRTYQVTVTNYLDDPAIGGIVINGHDVTDLVEAEREREERDAQYRFLAERASDLIYRYRFEPEPGFD